VEAEVSAAQRITVDDLRDKAESIRDQVKEDARRLAHEERMKMVIAGAVVVAVAVSFAYYMGSRRCRF
jgi:flagellar biosynthesis/type III secretory pathway M-ring protein FliF/YscJ